MGDTFSFLDALLVAKKHQATVLFGPWDFEGNGRIDITQLRPLLLSVFPPPSFWSQQGGPTAAGDYLSASQVKKAYESVTRRRWPPSCLPSAVSAPAQDSHGYQGLTPPGPTLCEVHAIIDFLCGGETHARLESSTERRDSIEEDAPTGLFYSDGPRRRGSTKAAASTCADGRPAASHTTAMSGANHLSSDARVTLLYGSMEAIYRTFCRAAVSPGELVSDTLPIDATHLKRLAWNVDARKLKTGEGHALHRLLTAKAALVEATTSTAEEDAHLTKEAFVDLLCTL
ncbi:hypothetical protein JKF63_04367 [Porcisia hertigi]|uniref:Uncharacterized protein n=1 Tax=Porcisia hertigi TaxID=2761500 RepID=A0A836LAD0_9TRYP|nr:hypothetical protein JKF63_04367 [Porcisia hertigi]